MSHPLQNRIGKRLCFPATLCLAGACLLGGCIDTTPEALRDQRELFATQDLEARDRTRVWLKEPLTLQQAITSSFVRNLDLQVTKQQQAIEREKLLQTGLKSLPNLYAYGDYSSRNKVDAYSIKEVESGFDFGGHYNSTEKDRGGYSLTLLWNVLDFGVTFVQAHQQMQQAAIAQQKMRRAKQNLALDITQAYWYALAARDRATEAKDLNLRIQEARQLIAEQRKALMKGASAEALLRVDMQLLGVQKELSTAIRESQKAKLRLAQLAGIPRDQPFDLPVASWDTVMPLPIQAPLTVMELHALEHRPELFVSDLKRKVEVDEARIALLKMLPSPAMYTGAYYNGDKHLYNNDWTAAGLYASYDLLSLPQKIAHFRAIKSGESQVVMHRKAAAVGILIQLRLALLQHEENRRQLAYNRELFSKAEQVLAATQQRLGEGVTSPEMVLQEYATYINAANYYYACADAEIAHARIENTLGRDIWTQWKNDAHTVTASFQPDGDNCPIYKDTKTVACQSPAQ